MQGRTESRRGVVKLAGKLVAGATVIGAAGTASASGGEITPVGIATSGDSPEIVTRIDSLDGDFVVEYQAEYQPTSGGTTYITPEETYNSRQDDPPSEDDFVSATAAAVEPGNDYYVTARITDNWNNTVYSNTVVLEA